MLGGEVLKTSMKVILTLLLTLQLTLGSFPSVWADEDNSSLPAESETTETVVNDQKEETIVITVDGDSVAEEEQQEEASQVSETETQEKAQEEVQEESENEEEITLLSVDIQPPTAPRDLRITMVTNTTVTIEWSPSLDNQGVAEYIIYNNYEPVGTTSNTSYVLFDVSNEETFFITIRAKDYSGNVSDSSSALCFYHVQGNEIVSEVLPAPSNLQIDRVWENKLTLTWQVEGDTPQDVEYEVYNGDVLIGTTREPYYVVTNLENETSYAFKVRAVNLDNSASEFSNIVAVYHVQDDELTTLPLLPPTNARIDSSGQNSVTLKWDTPNGSCDIKEYVVYDEDRVVGITSANSYVITGLVNEDTYVFTVKSKDYSDNLSESSNTVLLYHINEEVKDLRKITAYASVNGSNITVTGTALANNTATIAVRNIQNQTIYTANTVCNSTNGSFTVNFAMPINSTAGLYTVTASCEGIEAPAVTTFQYVIPAILNVSAQTDTNNLLGVSGNTNVGEGKNVSLNITKQGASTPLFAMPQTTATLTNGSFAFTPITMPESATDGIYVATIVCEGVSAPAVKTFVYERTQSGEITAEIGISNRTVTINGTSSAGEGKAVTILVRDKENNIAYINQGVSGTDGNFEFIFTMPETAASGEYEVRLGGEGIETACILTYDYTKAVIEIETAVIDADITIQNYVMTISGIISCEENKKIVFLIKNTNNSTVYLDEDISNSDGEYSFTCTLPNLLNTASYLAEIKAYDVSGGNEAEIASLSTNIDTAFLSSSAEGTAGCQDGVRMEVSVKETNTNLIDKTLNLNGEDGVNSFSYDIPTLALANLSFDLNAVIYEESVAEPEEQLITAEVTVNDSVVTVGGITQAGEGKAVTILVRDKENNIAYINQGVSGTEGIFQFIFNLSSSALSGEYTVLLGGEGIITPLSKSFVYGTITYSVTNLDIGVNKYIVNVTGSSNYEAGKTLSLNIVRNADNISLFTTAKTALTLSDGSFSFEPITMPSNATAGQYSVVVTAEGEQTSIIKAFEYSLITEGDISAQVTVDNRAVTVSGSTAAGSNKAVTILVRGSDGNIAYINQGTSDSNGDFEFIFTMPNSAVSGKYTAMLGGDGVSTTTTIEFDYTAGIAAPLTAGISVGDTVITVSGTTNIGAGKTISLNANKKGQSTQLFATPKTTLTLADGSYAFTINISELAGNGEYTVTVTAEGVQVPVVKNFIYPQTVAEPLTAPVLLPVQNNDITDKTVKLSWYGSQGGSGTITYSLYVNGNLLIEQLTGTSYVVQNLSPKTQYAFKLVAKDSLGTEATSNILSVTTKESAVVSVSTNTIQINCIEDKTYNIIVVGKNITDLSNKVFTLEYDPQKLEAIDLCSLTKAADVTEGTVTGTDIIITEFDEMNGTIKFKLNKSFEGKQWTGVVNAVRFKSLVGNDQKTTIMQWTE